ncbi:MAG: hypothetical protein CVU04_00735 [Bacteroidetes bacterium HGW-Bacteroidetes-20]|nr:MAG: hypothetical protein CVU04_00735 [Bacteroidetes bacterium HGW-Bacteroidetes-20]
MKVAFLKHRKIGNLKKSFRTYPWVFTMLILAFTSCENDGLKEKTATSSYVSKVGYNFLSNFGIFLEDDLYSNGVTFKNKYATKVVVFDYAMYDKINSRNELIALIDNGVRANYLPTIDLDIYEPEINFCFGVLINDDYYLVRFDYLSCVIYDSEDQETRFFAYIDLKYKF